MKKVFMYISGIVLFLITCSFIVLYGFFPNVEASPQLEVQHTPQQVERGRYLANHVALCMDCHSERVWTKYSGPLNPESLGKGGEIFDENMGFPGVFYSKNITPYNLQHWTDGEIFRLITTGVNKDGKAIFPVMPYPFYRNMAVEDVEAIIAYLRTLEPVESVVPESKASFPLNFILRTIPEKYETRTRPAPENPLEYGEYITQISACAECHTPKVNGKTDMDKYMAGGFEFKLPGGTVRSANLTPDSTSGLGGWNEDTFVQRFKQYEGLHWQDLPDVAATDFNTVMPWTMYAGMKEDDLKAIFTYLQSLTPIENKVDRFTPASAISENP